METITMSGRDPGRAWVLARLLGNELTLAEAAGLLGLSGRSVRRLRGVDGEPMTGRSALVSCATQDHE
jgi:hypothetical protein